MKWNSCKDKMPQRKGTYIVTEKWYSYRDKQHKGEYSTCVSLAEYDIWNNIFWRPSECEVIAWMEFPKPYKP